MTKSKNIIAHYKQIVGLLIVAVAFFTVYALMLPATTMTVTPLETITQTVGEGDDAVTVTVDIPEGAFPGSVDMQLELVELLPYEEEMVLDAAEQKEAALVKAVDISFYDLETGEELEPAVALRVTMSSPVIAELEETAVVHLTDDGVAEAVTMTMPDTIEEDAAQLAFLTPFVFRPEEPEIPWGGGMPVVPEELPVNPEELPVNPEELPENPEEVVDPENPLPEGEEAAVPAEGAENPEETGTETQKEAGEAEKSETSENTETSENQTKEDTASSENKDADSSNSSDKSSDSSDSSDSSSDSSTSSDTSSDSGTSSDSSSDSSDSSDSSSDSSDSSDSSSDSSDSSDSSSDSSDSSDSVSFEADSFSVYAIVGKTIEKEILASDGHNYRITVTPDESANIPAGATLEVQEIDGLSEEYTDYVEKTQDALSVTEKVAFARFFDISIMNGEEEIQPEAPVQVTIELADELDDTVRAVHFGSEVELLDVAYEEPTVSFQASGFSVYGVVLTEEITTEFISDGGQRFEVTVRYDQNAQIPEGATLKVTEFEDNSEEYAFARNAVLADKLERQEYVDTDDFYLSALDISILNAEGEEIEPAAAVQVDIRIKELPGVEDLSKIRDSLEIQHHVETENGIVVEPVLYGIDDGSFALTNKEETLRNTDRVAVDPSSVTEERLAAMKAAMSEDEGLAMTDGEEDSADELDLSFDTEVFSTFTVNWSFRSNRINYYRSSTIHYGYMNGSRFVEFPNGTPDLDPFDDFTTSSSPQFLILDVPGYEFDSAHLDSASGTEIEPMVRYNNSRWQYTPEGSVDWANIAYGSGQNVSQDIYMIYKPLSQPTNGGTPKVKQSGTTEPPQDPTILKESQVNGNGTNTLSLSVQGDTTNLEVEKLADVIIVFDRSGSMSTSFGSGTRLSSAVSATNALADDLLTRKNSDGGKLIRFSLVEFSNTANVVVPLSDDANSASQDPEKFKNALKGVTADGGTNWEQALQVANRLEVDPERATFVIFVTDGNPTWRMTRYDVTSAQLRDNDMHSGTTYQYYRQYNVFGQGNSDIYGRNYDAALAEATSIVSNKKNFYTIGISEDVTNLDRLTSDSGAGEDHSFTANDNDELVKAFDDIKASIEAMLGWSNVQINDGITNLSSIIAKSDAYVSIGDEFTYSKGHAATAEDVAAGKAQNVGDMVWESWTPSSEGCAEAEYNPDTGAVEWHMGESFMPQKGITYKVSFLIWPSQQAYDTLAALRNAANPDTYYNSLAPEVRAQFYKNGSGAYVLRTNTEDAGYSYQQAQKTGDKVTPSGDPISDTFDPVDDLNLAVDNLRIKKLWQQNYVDSRTPRPVDLRLVNEAGTELVTMSATPDGSYSWESGPIYISTGLMTEVNGNVTVYETGHDFRIEEYGSEAHYYDLVTDQYRPMVINTQTVMLKRSTNVPSAMGSADYYSDGTTRYYRIQGNVYETTAAGATLTATNTHRSALDLTKKVVSAGTTQEVSANELFTFDITINVDPETLAADPGVEQYVFFSINDANGTALDMTQITTTAKNPSEYGSSFASLDGRYRIAESGEELSLSIKAGWNVRFVNLPIGSTYSIEETRMGEGYSFESGRILARQGESASPVAEFETESCEGTINSTNTIYQVEYTNSCEAVNVTIHKTGSDGQTGLQGAKFDLYSKEGYEADPKTKLKTDLISDENGLIDLGPLSVGEYRLVETEAPARYNKLTEPVEITVNANGTVSYVQIENSLSSGGNGVTGNAEDGYQLVVINTTGEVLPSTGGSGTGIYTVSGSVILLAAGMLLVLKKKRQAEGV